MSRVRPDGKNTTYRSDTYLSDIPRDGPLFKNIKSYIDAEYPVSTRSYDYARPERRILERSLMGRFEYPETLPPDPKDAEVVVVAPPKVLSNPRARKLLL